MVQKLIRIVVALVIFLLLWWAVGLIVAAAHAPAIVGTIVTVLFILAAVIFIAYEFGLWSSPPK